MACDMEHTHHPYWRLHFDIDGQGQDQLLVRRGDKWAIHSTEAEDLKVTAAGSANWLVRRPDSRRGVWIVPGGAHAAFDVLDSRWTYAVYRRFFEEIARYEAAAPVTVIGERARPRSEASPRRRRRAAS